MAVRWDEAQQFVGFSAAEEPDRDFRARIGNIDPLERHGIAGSLQRIYRGFEAALVEPMDRLRRHERSLGVRFRRVHIGKEVGEDRKQIKRGQDKGPPHRELMLAKAPPHELPLRGDGNSLFREVTRFMLRSGFRRGFHPQRNSRRIDTGTFLRCTVFRHHCRPRRILGSIHIRSRSEMNVPMTVSTPRSRTMVPARNMSCAISAFRSRGPTVGRLKTSDTMMLPETM